MAELGYGDPHSSGRGEVRKERRAGEPASRRPRRGQETGRIEEVIAPFARQVAQLDEVPGIGRTGAQELIAEVGVDMTRFATAGHLVSWAKNAPKARQSAGKSKPGTTGKGNPWLASTLGEAFGTCPAAGEPVSWA